MASLGTAISDVHRAVYSFRIWNLLAMQDIRQRYRRSVLGPFWITMSTLISIAALGIVYSKIFHTPLRDYLPFLATGLVCWTFISGLVMESCAVFTQSESIIKQVNLPFGLYVFRMVWRNIIILGHNLIVIVAVNICFGLYPTWTMLGFLPALGLTAVCAVAVGYLLGALCTRFRDLPQIITSLVQVIFYVTPVIWKPALLKGHEELMNFNPFFHFLEIMRAPLINETPQSISADLSIAITVILSVAALLFFARFKKRIAYWL